MCSHNTFKVIYYSDGVMLRRCITCKKIEMHLDRSWHALQPIRDALDWLDASGLLNH